MSKRYKLFLGDCLDVMKKIPDKFVDAIICDLPYGTTACKWDIVIPFDKLWEQYLRIAKKDSAIVLFGTEPFSSRLRCSMLSLFRYDWIWNKEYGTDFQLAKLRPMRTHETISVFSKGKTANGAKINMKYYPQKTPLEKPVKNGGAPTTKLLNKNSMTKLDKVYTEKSPQTIIYFKPVFNSLSSPRLHPTQKPVALIEYLIKTYTKEGDIVLDNCMGSGTTGIACMNLNRKFIGIEKEEKYFNIAKKRIEEAENERT